MIPTELIAMMQQDPSKAQELVEAALAERAASDPTLAMMMQMLTTRAAPSTDEATSPAEASTAEQIQDLKAALANSYELLDDLAAGLGACAACWGDDTACAACRGRGRSGWRRPEDDRFRALIAPAVARRVAREVVVTRSPVTDPSATRSPGSTTLEQHQGENE